MPPILQTPTKSVTQTVFAYLRSVFISISRRLQCLVSENSHDKRVLNEHNTVRILFLRCEMRFTAYVNYSKMFAL